MHDPKTLAFDMRVGKFRLAEIWHVDPEQDGTDDSCGWTYPRLSESEMTLAYRLIHNEHDNLRHWFADIPETNAVYRIQQIFRIHKAHVRRWWQHPRWHVHHWEIKIVPVFKFKRWLFSRCAHCGQRFSWDYAPTCTIRNGTGPLWFRSEANVYHHDCYRDMESSS